MAREMKDSGVAWIGEIPKTWTRTKLLNALRSPISDGPHETPALVEDGIPFISIDSLGATESVDLSCCKKFISKDDYLRYMKKTKIEKGDILFSKAATIGKTAIVGDEIFMVWSPLAIIKVNSCLADNKYIYHILNCTHFIKHISLLGSFNTQINVGMREIETAMIPLPSIREQRLIVAFLDKKCVEIDAVLEKTRTSIEEYKKLKQAIITQAVTKGVRGDRPMKECGIEWMGSCPADWTIIKIKWLLEEEKDRSIEGTEEPLSMSQKYGILPTKEMDLVPNMASSFVGAKLVHRGNLVFNKLKAHLGVFAVSGYDGLVSPDYAVYRTTNLSNAAFLEYLFKTPQYISEFKKKSTGIAAGLTRLYTDGLYSIFCALPPLAEQQEIIRYLQGRIATIDALIHKKEQFVSELETYKKSLIYEYVTGKKEALSIGETYSIETANEAVPRD